MTSSSATSKRPKPPSKRPARHARPKIDPVTARWIFTRSDQVAAEEGCYFDQASADAVCDFFERFLCHSKGQFAAAKFALEPWQRKFLSQLYGWKRRDGTRRFREAYLEVPKKNGKSTLLSGLVLYAIFEEAAAEVYLGAVDRAQASIIFDEAARMIRASPVLTKHLKIIRSKKTITFEATDSKIVAMSADAPSKDGVSSSLTALDETHRHKNSDLYDVMKFAGAARAEPLLINITTAGHDRRSLCWQLHERALSVIKGTAVDVEFLATIFAADPVADKDKLGDPATWMKANPSMPAVLSLEDFRKAYEEAKRLPRTWNAFLRLRLNIWTSSDVGWIPVEKWTPLKKALPPGFLKGRKCFGALDLSSRKDLTALALLFPYGRGKVHLVPYFFIPEETLEERMRTDKTPYDQWIRDGWLHTTPGSSIDHETIRKKVLELAGDHDLTQLALDSWGIQQLFNQLDGDGLDMVGVRQGYQSLSNPSKDFEARILDGKISHDGNPVMEWCVENCAVEMDGAENIKPSKKKSTKRIDGVVAAVMTLFLLDIHKPKPKPKVGMY